MKDSVSTIFAASLGFGSEKGSTKGVSASVTFGNFGLFAGAGIFPNNSDVGFHFDMDLHFLNWASTNEGGLGTSAYKGEKSFGLSYQVGLGPSFKKEDNDILIQFTPELSIALELETGKVHYNTNYYSYSVAYTYCGFLFGFGGDLSVALTPTDKFSFVLGTHLAYYPVYKPSVSVSTKSGETTYTNHLDIDFDNYSRFMMNFYLGVQIHQHK